MSAQTINIEVADVYANLTSLSGVSGSLVVTNNSASPAYLAVAATQPSANTLGILCWNSEEVFVQRESGKYIWIRLDNPGPVLVQEATAGSSEESNVECKQVQRATTRLRTQAIVQ